MGPMSLRDRVLDALTGENIVITDGPLDPVAIMAAYTGLRPVTPVIYAVPPAEYRRILALGYGETTSLDGHCCIPFFYFSIRMQ